MIDLSANLQIYKDKSAKSCKHKDLSLKIKNNKEIRLFLGCRMCYLSNVFKPQTTMISKKKLLVRDQEIGLDDEFVNLTDIAKRNSDRSPDETLRGWMRNAGTLQYLEEWEIQNNPKFKPDQMAGFRLRATEERHTVSVKQYVDQTNAAGIYAKRGRGGGTYAHIDIAISFCYWLSPKFAVWMVRAFKMLMRNELDRQNLEFHIGKITDSIDEARNWLDTVPGQKSDRNRIKGLDKDQ